MSGVGMDRAMEIAGRVWAFVRDIVIGSHLSQRKTAAPVPFPAQGPRRPAKSQTYSKTYLSVI